FSRDWSSDVCSSDLAGPVLACNPDLFERLDTPLRTEADVSFEAKERASTEGGEWRIWSASADDGAEVARIDYGEMGRTETRLMIDRKSVVEGKKGGR